MGSLVDKLRYDECHAHDDGPLDAVHPVSLLVAHATGRLIDMRLEESHHGCHEVPCQIDSSQEDDRANGNLIGEQHLDVVHKTGFLTLVILSGKFRALLQTTLQVPSDEGYHEQREEHHTR